MRIFLLIKSSALKISCLTLLIAIIGCKSSVNKYTYSNSSILAYDLVQQCVDTMLNTNPAINTKNYVLDMSYCIDSLNRKGIDSFLNLKESMMSISSDDSLIIFENGNPDKFHMKQSMIIRFDSILSIERNRVVVKARKIKSWQEAMEVTIELKQKGWGYEIRKFLQTN